MDDVISRQAAIKTINKVRDVCDTESLDDYRDLLTECFEVMPPAQPELKELSEWKADFKGFINALDMPKDDYNGIMEYIDELPPAQPEQRWIPCGKCIHADGKHRWCKVLDRTINEDYFCYWAEPFREEGEADG